jgi:hypothetical protein
VRALKFQPKVVALAIFSIFTAIFLFTIVSADNCWDYDETNQLTCEAVDTDSDGSADDCWWDDWGSWCMSKGCWDIKIQADCTSASTDGCFWKTDSDMGWSTGWCQESANCQNYNNESGCYDASVGCQWKNTSCQGPSGCSDFSASSDCTGSYLGCWWDSGDYCNKPGCSDYYGKSNCELDSSCSWNVNTYCSQLSTNC